MREPRDVAAYAARDSDTIFALYTWSKWWITLKLATNTTEINELRQLIHNC